MTDLSTEEAVALRKLLTSLSETNTSHDDEGVEDVSPFEKVDMIVERLADLEERVDDLEAENDDLRDELADTRSKATAAVTMLASGDEDESKTELAKRLTRNMLVVRAAKGAAGQDRPVTVGDIQTRAEEVEGVELAWSIVDRAWSNLCEEWPQFHETSKGGNQALSIRPSNVTEALATIVQADLGRDDLTKRFVGETTEEGVEA